MRDRLAAARPHGLLVARLGMAVERGIDRALGPVGRAPDKGEIFALQRRRCGRDRRTGATAPVCARSFLATTISPVVSLSSRCTMPGRFTPPIPDRLAPQCAISALTSVPDAVPGGRMHHQPLRLVDHDQRIVLVDDIERDILRLPARPAHLAGR